MIRSSVLTSLFAVVLLMTCAAQDERRSLENSVTRLEQRLARMDEYLKALQSSQSQAKEEKIEALQQAQKELAKLRELVLAQEKSMREETAATEKKMEALRKAADQRAAQQEKAAAESKRKEQTVAQEAERAKIAESKARAEQQTLAEKARMLSQELEQSKKVANERAAENAKLAKEKEALVAAAKQQRDRSGADQDEVKRQKEASKQQVEEARRQVEDLKRQLATKDADSKKRGDDYSRTVELLSQERREIERLRDAVKNDLATESKRATEAARKRAETQELRAREADEEMVKLRSQNASLKKQVQALEQAKDLEPAKAQPRLPAVGFDDFGPAPAPARAAPSPARNDAPPGTIIVNNADGGEVHFHFHGGAPNINQPAQAPRPAPKQAEPAEKNLKVKEPAKSKDSAPKEEGARRINEDPEPVAASLVRVLAAVVGDLSR